MNIQEYDYSIFTFLLPYWKIENLKNCKLVNSIIIKELANLIVTLN